VILDHLASGAMSLTSVRLLRRHLTPENHEAVLARACGRRRREIEALVAELAPRADVPFSVRKLPTVAPVVAPAPVSAPTPPPTRVEGAIVAPPEPPPPFIPPPFTPPPVVPTRRPIIETTSPERYRVQFTIGKESHEKLRRVQALLRREIPSGDPGAIFDRPLTLLLEKVERTKLGAAKKLRPRPIRPGTDRQLRTPIVPSRDLPRHVQRAVCQRDGDQCAFVSRDGHRCTERTFLEFHHILPYAKGGLATVENISLRCRRHNQYEAKLVFGPHGTSEVREAQGSWPAPAAGYLPTMATSSTSNRSGVFGGIVGGDPALP
jgi:5-methylcytosine-specific restriction endonuclease McrA